MFTEFQQLFDNLIDEWGSTIVFTPLTKSSTYGGYSGSESQDTVNQISTKGIPASLVMSRIGFRDFGDIEAGTTRVVIKSSVNIQSGTEYEVTWAGETWNLESVQNRGNFEDVSNNAGFKVVVLRKQL